MTCVIQQGPRWEWWHSPRHRPLIWILRRGFWSGPGLVYDRLIVPVPASCQWRSHRLSRSFITPARLWISWMSSTDRKEAEGEECSLASWSLFVSSLGAIIVELMKQRQVGVGLDLDINSWESTGSYFVFHWGGPFTPAVCRCVQHASICLLLYYFLTLTGLKTLIGS